MFKRKKPSSKDKDDKPSIPYPLEGNWVKRDPNENRFKHMKRKGGPFKGVKREK